MTRGEKILAKMPADQWVTTREVGELIGEDVDKTGATLRGLAAAGTVMRRYQNLEENEGVVRMEWYKT